MREIQRCFSPTLNSQKIESLFSKLPESKNEPILDLLEIQKKLKQINPEVLRANLPLYIKNEPRN